MNRREHEINRLPCRRAGANNLQDAHVRCLIAQEINII